MRTRMTAVWLLGFFAVAVAAQSSPDPLLEQGVRAYRAGNHQAAVQSLEKAAQAFLSPERMQAYVATGRYEGLASLERTLVYLALAQGRLGCSDEARAAIQRLVSAERITPTYATLGLPDADAAAFEALAKSVMPSASLPKRIDIAGDEPAGPLPAVRARGVAAEAERLEREKVIGELFALERERAERETESRIAAEKAAAEKAAAERIAAERAGAEKTAAERIAAEKAAAEKAAADRIAALQREAAERIAAAEADAKQRIAAAEADAKQKIAAAEAEANRRIAATHADAAERIAAAELEAKRLADARIAELERQTQDRIAAERTAVEKTAAERIAGAEAGARHSYAAPLAQAEAAATKGRIAEAREIYLQVAEALGAPRDAIAESAVGLYRTGAFRQAVHAFRRLGTFQPGEEGLRYYHAVSLYEIGELAAAQQELAAALPFIKVNDDVNRYRIKIERSAAQKTVSN